MTISHESVYALGSTDAEHARLVRQAAWLVAHTERLFGEARIGPGQRVLDLGSGVGDVALIAARLVGPSGRVVGIERDPRSIERARARMAEQGLAQVTFVQTDVSEISSDEWFDAAVGRYILMFLPDPASVLRSVAGFVRPGGALAFQETDWTSFREEVARLPLWSMCADLAAETLRRCGANTDMGSALPRVFQEAGLPAPAVRVDRLTGAEDWLPDCLHSLRPKMEELGLPLEALGDFGTLHERLRREVSALKTTIPLPAIVSAWSCVRRLPTLANVSLNERHAAIAPESIKGWSK
jgi:SAM-dependent methyltransferase